MYSLVVVSYLLLGQLICKGTYRERYWVEDGQSLVFSDFIKSKVIRIQSVILNTLKSVAYIYMKRYKHAGRNEAGFSESERMFLSSFKCLPAVSVTRHSSLVPLSPAAVSGVCVCVCEVPVRVCDCACGSVVSCRWG